MARLRMSMYFAALKEALEKHGLLDAKEKIWNMDETGLCLTAKPPKVMSRKGNVHKS
ncbi:hypothetical protein DPMN_132289 [Dreissena polymorpha]|uniref:Uncharacterized protein n=1 Tax=Dreissena polymorpha TaxID=45954 RepID=A0A9D4FWG7_DREPO|nr:hypothetical protein DPMN_132289 [Dreissena polymorpha]